MACTSAISGICSRMLGSFSTSRVNSRKYSISWLIRPSSSFVMLSMSIIRLSLPETLLYMRSNYRGNHEWRGSTTCSCLRPTIPCGTHGPVDREDQDVVARENRHTDARLSTCRHGSLRVERELR